MPALHELITVLTAPDLVLSGSDGQIRPGGPQGWYSKDRRALSQLEITVAEGVADTIGLRRNGPSSITVHSAITGIAPDASDPTVTISRHRALSPSALTDRVELTNHGASAATLTLRARASSDLAEIGAVRSARLTQPAVPLLHDEDVRWEAGDITVSLRCSTPPTSTRLAETGVELTWRVNLQPRDRWSVDLVGACDQRAGTGFTPLAGVDPPQWTLQELPGTVVGLVEANLADLDALLLADPSAPADLFAAAGSPWYLTLFGRDALWTARMLLPLGVELAAGTLRTLARRQAARHDLEAEAAPGKILHEARPAPQRTGTLSLPAIYYGTIDATPLWVCLLHDAWQAGMSQDEVAALLPNLVAAMSWITGSDADPDGDGLLEYAGSSGGGLANQGWKDSADAIRHLDGRFAAAPVALCEVQGYAYAAAIGAASLAGAFGLPDEGAAWLAWARRLRDRFHEVFWLRDEVGPYPAIALEADKVPVSGATSNMAHLLGTGLLSPDQARDVATRLAARDLTTDYGLRTMTMTSAAYNPISYHCGSVWPHDTAIAITGLVAEGHHELAGVLARGLVRAAGHFEGRPPELYGVLEEGPPVHYPSACRPQAWAAAAIIVAALHVR